MYINNSPAQEAGNICGFPQTMFSSSSRYSVNALLIKPRPEGKVTSGLVAKASGKQFTARMTKLLRKACCNRTDLLL